MIFISFLIVASYIFGFTNAKYANGTSTSTAATSTSTAFFSNVQLLDAYTGSRTSTDKNHWFAIEAEVYVSAGYSDDIYLTVPAEFGTFPESPFELLDGADVIGRVSYNSSNVFTVSFKDDAAKDRTGTFTLLTKLTSDGLEKIPSPRTINYVFDVSTGSSFTQPIAYVAKDISSVTKNAGVSENGKAWFTVDIPTSGHPSSFNFASIASGSNDYNFDTSLTSFKIVTEVDSFNQPEKSTDLTAFTDDSDESAIELSFHSTISGRVKYIRIQYQTEVVSANYIENTATLDYPTSSKQKRDDSIIFNDRVYMKSLANPAQLTKALTVETGTGVSTITGYNSSFSAPTSILTAETASQAISGTNSNSSGHLTYSLATKTQSGEYSIFTSWFAVSTLPTTTTTLSATVATNGSVTYSQTTFTSGSTFSRDSVDSASISVSNDTVTSSTATASRDSNSSISTSSSSTIAHTNATTSHLVSKRLTYTVLTKTKGAKATEYTSWFAIGTIPTTSSLSATSTLKSVNTSIAEKTFTVVTKTEGGKVTEYTSWFAVSTLSTANPVSNTKNADYSVGNSTNTLAPQTTITKTENGKVITCTACIPVSSIATIESEAPHLVTITTGEKLSTSTKKFGYTTTIKSTDAAKVTVYNSVLGGSSIADSAISHSTEKQLAKTTKESVQTLTLKSTATAEVSAYSSILGGSVIASPVTTSGFEEQVATSTRKYVQTTTLVSTGAPQLSVYTSPLGGSSISTSATYSPETVAISIYEGSGSHLDYGVSGIVAGILLFAL